MIPQSEITDSPATLVPVAPAPPAVIKAPWLAEALPPAVAASLQSRLPTARRTMVLYQPVPPPMAQSLDVDRVGAILFATDLGSSSDLFALFEDMVVTDSHLQAEFSTRKLAVLGDQLTITAANPKSPDDKLAAELVKDQIDTLPSWWDACKALLDSTIWPVAVVEKTFRPSSRRNLAYDVDQLIRVSPRLFDYQTHKLRIRDVSPEGFIEGTSQAPDPMRYIIHRGHLLTAPDQRGGPMRCMVWWWLFKHMSRDWWVKLLDRWGTPFPVGKFDSADEYSRVVLTNAFQLATRLGGLVVSKETDVEMHESNSQSGGDAFDKFRNAANSEMSKIIVGQESTSTAKATGMNSGIGKEHGHVREDIRQYDGNTLGFTLVQQLWQPWLRINGLRGRIVIRFGAEEAEDIAKTSDAISKLSGAGLELTEAGITDLSERFGLPFQRKAAPVLPGSPDPSQSPRPNRLFSLRAGVPAGDQAELLDAANLQIARGGSADLAQALGETAADLRTLALRASDAHDLEMRLRLYFANLPPGRIARHFEDSLTAFVTQGAAAAAVEET